MSNQIAASRNSYRRLTASAMFAAMIAVTTAYLFHIPVGANGGYLHFGDAFIYLAASLLPLPYACAAAAVGGGIADLVSGAGAWMLPTMLIKPLAALLFTSRSHKLACPRNTAALIYGGFVTVAGYYLAEVVLTGGNWLAPAVSVWANVIQAAGSAAVYLVMAVAIDRFHVKPLLKLG